MLVRKYYFPTSTCDVGRVAWSREVDAVLWDTQGGHTLPLLKDPGVFLDERTIR